MHIAVQNRNNKVKNDTLRLQVRKVIVATISNNAQVCSVTYYSLSFSFTCLMCSFIVPTLFSHHPKSSASFKKSSFFSSHRPLRFRTSTRICPQEHRLHLLLHLLTARTLQPDAPELVHAFLIAEPDASGACKYHAFVSLCFDWCPGGWLGGRCRVLYTRGAIASFPNKPHGLRDDGSGRETLATIVCVHVYERRRAHLRSSRCTTRNVAIDDVS